MKLKVNKEIKKWISAGCIIVAGGLAGCSINTYQEPIAIVDETDTITEEEHNDILTLDQEYNQCTVYAYQYRMLKGDDEKTTSEDEWTNWETETYIIGTEGEEYDTEVGQYQIRKIAIGTINNRYTTDQFLDNMPMRAVNFELKEVYEYDVQQKNEQGVWVSVGTSTGPSKMNISTDDIRYVSKGENTTIQKTGFIMQKYQKINGTLEATDEYTTLANFKDNDKYTFKEVNAPLELSLELKNQLGAPEEEQELELVK